MTVYDVFNGDADGICALIQLRLDQPQQSERVTGVKRDIALLSRVVPDAGDHINVLDISMEKNRRDLLRVLDSGASVFYCDHHVAGDIPRHGSLTSLINTEANVCTSLLINGHLRGAYAPWAVVGAYGDNLVQSAEALAKTLSLSASQCGQLQNLGIYINYNGYGASLDDLHFSPLDLFARLSRYDTPLEFIADDSESYQCLEEGYRRDMSNASACQVLRASASAAAFLLPDEKWARRVSGVYGNDLANDNPERAHAVLTEKADGSYLVSVRAPLNDKRDADQLCGEFPSGGGRKAAAGINALPAELLAHFLDRLEETYR